MIKPIHFFSVCFFIIVGPLNSWVLNLWIQSSLDQKYLKKSYIIADVYYVVRPKVVVSVLNMHQHFVWSLFLEQYSTTIYIAFTLY